MNKFIVVAVFAAFLSGCASAPSGGSIGAVATVKSWIPSFWDDNQSSRAIDMVLYAHRIDCESPEVGAQVQQLRDSIDWFKHYSKAKGWLQDDVVRVVEPISETVSGFEDRIAKGKFSPAYCKIKTGILVQQTERAAEAILGRY